MTRRIVLVALAMVGAAALAWLATRIERVTETKSSAMSAEARRNPYLAAQRLLTRMGVATREAKDFADLGRMQQFATLILPNRRQTFAPVYHARLQRWVERGGHLIIETEPVGVADPLVDALHVERERAPRTPAETVKVVFPRGATPLEVLGLGARQRLAPPGAGVLQHVETARGVQLLQLERGEGRVTVVTDLAFAENHMIGRADNAEFLWRIVRSGPAESELLVFRSLGRLSLWRWLVEHAFAALASGAALLALWLWSIGPRFGPLAADPPPARRRLLDHLRASGRFYWRHNGRARLIGAACEACLARLARAQPGFTLLAPAERAGQVAAFAGISHAEAARLLAPGEVRGGADFIALMRALQQVHARLDGVKTASR